MSLHSTGLRVHAFLPRSLSNGPGCRAVVWVQGCSLGCPGCFNPEAHDFGGGEVVSVSAIYSQILMLGDTIEGISVSGGEPLQQMDAVLELLKSIKANTRLSVVLFSGYKLDEIRQIDEFDSIPSLVDVLIAGRYAESERCGPGLLGSANQQIVFFGDRYSEADVDNTPAGEVIISEGGLVEITGIDPLVL